MSEHDSWDDPKYVKLHGDTGHRNPMYDMGWPISFHLVNTT